MFGKRLAEHGVTHLYCIDHNLHLNAKIAFEDSNLPDSENAMKAARSQVQFFNSSTQALDKLCNMQQTTREGEKPLKVIQDVQTRWWSTWKMLHRLLVLTPTIDALIASRQVNTPPLTPHQKKVLTEVEHLLAPIAKAQKTLEGDKYPTISFVPFFIWKLREHLKSQSTESAVMSLTESTRHLAQRMYSDFVNNRYGDGNTVFHDGYVLGNLQRYISLHKIVLVATFLDPRFKSLHPFVPITDRDKVHQYVLSLMNNIARNEYSTGKSDTNEGDHCSTEMPMPLDDLDPFFSELATRNIDTTDSPMEDTFMLCSSELNWYMRVQQIATNHDPL